VLAGSALAMTTNALFIRDRAIHTGGPDAAPTIAKLL
jgi:hypothetical protein